MRNNVKRNSTKSSKWGEPEKCGSTEIQIWPKLSVKWGQGGGGGQRRLFEQQTAAGGSDDNSQGWSGSLFSFLS